MIKINGKMINKNIKELDLFQNKLTYLSVEIGQLTQLSTLNLYKEYPILIWRILYIFIYKLIWDMP